MAYDLKDAGAVESSSAGDSGILFGSPSIASPRPIPYTWAAIWAYIQSKSGDAIGYDVGTSEGDIPLLGPSGKLPHAQMNLADVPLTGTPTAPTPADGDDSTKIATTEYLDRLRGVADGIATLDSGGKVPTAQLPASVIGAVSFQGTWNATTNSPSLASGVGTKGHYYIVATAGTTTLDTIAEWAIGDWAIFDGTVWRKVDNTDAVVSVAGLTGVISAAGLKTALAIAIADVTSLQGSLDAKAPLASPALTGTPTAPTATLGTDTTQVATTEFVQDAVGAAGAVPVGAMLYWPSSVLPAGYLERDGAAVSRTTYAALFAVLMRQATATMTIASPCVVTWTSHGLSANDVVKFSTTGALPTGVTAGTTYYVRSTGLTANTFQISTSAGGGAVNTSGSQSGTHTAIHAPFGNGDGSTTFNLPDDRGEFERGWDHGRGIDSNRSLGSAQSDSIKEHEHTVSSASANSGGSFTALVGGAGGSNTGGMVASPGAETRPRNRAYMAIIKY